MTHEYRNEAWEAMVKRMWADRGEEGELRLAQHYREAASGALAALTEARRREARRRRQVQRQGVLP